MDKSRAELVTKYFLESPKKPSYSGPITWMVIGGLIAVVGLATYNNNSGGASLVCGLGGGLGVGFLALLSYLGRKNAYDAAFAKTEPKATDEQMDIWMEQDRKTLMAESFNKLDLVNDNVINSHDPLIVIGPVSPTQVALGKDGIVRFSRYSIVIIYLSNYHLAAYNCVWDFVNAKVSEDSTQEYHYQDVVSVSTLTTNSNFTVTTRDGKTHPIATQQEFSLSVASGERIRVVVALPQAEGILREGKFLPSGADKAISTLRAMLREKKGGSLA